MRLPKTCLLEMKEAAKNLDFERAAEIRNLIKKIKIL
ncbi:UvrB/UvrC motif-containing protein [Patescibacteria group bacterium]